MHEAFIAILKELDYRITLDFTDIIFNFFDVLLDLLHFYTYKNKKFD